MLLGDAGKLSQILINLVGNGVKFTQKGNVTLNVDWKDHNGRQNSPVNLHFQVRDTGIGIPETKIKSIFKAFSQLSTSRKSTQRGTGLGLVIAGELVEMMGGKICVKSKPEVGTTFSFTVQFTVPAAETIVAKESETASSNSARAKLSGKPLQILVVEDEYINQILAVTLLEREGWKVQMAENGIQAINILKDNLFDLALMDIQMPGFDGYETTKTIRQQEKSTGRHLPIIAMTAYAVKGDREKCLAAGMDGYISKPINPERLRHEIKTVLLYNSTNQANPQTP
jgi:CheY-like chemotaxis protein